jgi:hypothetical protein
MSAEDSIETWSERVAGLGAEMLVDHGLIKEADFERATSIVAQETHLGIFSITCPARNTITDILRSKLHVPAFFIQCGNYPPDLRRVN